MAVEGLPPGFVHVELQSDQEGQGVDALEGRTRAVQEGGQVEGGVLRVGMVTAVDLHHRLDARVAPLGKEPQTQI